MTKASARNGTKIKKSTSACPNLGSAAHTSSNSAPASYLTKTQVHAAIAAIDIGANSKLKRVARYRAFTAGIDADDILQEAILRSLASRSCPAGLKIEHFLMAVMRSIASAAIAKRERNEKLFPQEFNLLVSPLGPEEVFEIAERADAWRQALDHVIGGSPEIERVVDGIDQGLCGRTLADFANTSQASLASVRKTIKRRAKHACTRICNLDEAGSLQASIRQGMS